MGLMERRCNRLYDATCLRFSDVLLEVWENLLAVVCGQYDHMDGSLENVNKRKQKFLYYTENCPSLQCQMEDLNETIDYYGSFLEYQYTMAMYINKCQRPLQFSILVLKITIHHCDCT